MRLYAEHIHGSGIRRRVPGARLVLERVPACRDPASFVAVMGLGLESANLEHTATFAARFREAGDEEGARVQEVVGLRRSLTCASAALVRALHRGLDFDAWTRALPAPLTPLLMRGRPLRRDARRRAGQPDRFLDELEAWQPEPTDSDRLGPEPRRRPRARGRSPVHAAPGSARRDGSPRRAARRVAPRSRRHARGRGVASRDRGRARRPRVLSDSACDPTLVRAGASPVPHPSAKVLRTVNGRAFSAALGPTLPEAAFVHDLEAAVAMLAARPMIALQWRVKRAFGMAGRGQRRIAPGLVSEANRAFLRSAIASEGGVMIEPDVAIVRELALHGVLAEDGALRLGRLVTQECDAHGQWLATTLAEGRGPQDAQGDHERGEAGRCRSPRGGLLGPLRHRRVPLSRRRRRRGASPAAERDQRALLDGVRLGLDGDVT